MLGSARVATTIPVTDIKRSRDFYENKLGLKVLDKDMPDDSVILEAGEGTQIYLYQRPPAPSQHTLAEFHVDNLEKVIEELGKKGVTMEQYDMPGLKTDSRGIATYEGYKGAWFKDPDGNILAVGQVTK